MKSIGVFSGSGGNGCTMLSVSMSKVLASKGNRVLHIFASGTNSYTFLEKNYAGSLDDIRLSLIGSNLTQEELNKTIKKVDDIYVLTSSKKYLLANTFPLNSYEQIMNKLENFDYVVIDGGYDFRSALTMGSICSCDYRIFSISQRPSVISKFLDLENTIFRRIGTMSIVVNMFLKDRALYSKEDIAYLLKNENLIVIPFSQYGVYAEIERRTILFDKKYRKAVEKIIHDIVGDNNE